ncbi:MAG TPA: arginase family protein, partial [Candidatus Limnocylindrales bacterium]|nr:arginase family protein [Candidatus Limnocylindrales bacterium]
MSGRIVVVGAPTALGGHLSGMERTPAGLRALGLLDRVGRLVPDGALDDAGDLSIEPGFRPDPDRRTKNREPIAAFLPRLAERVAWALGPGGDPRVGDAGGRDRRTGGHPPPSPEGPGDRSASTERRADSRLLLLGGDCTTHAGALAGLRRAHPGRTFGLAWFDAHGDFNTPDTTPSGNVWGMPFAMI